ncbi:MAG: hypothetical protein VKL20_07105, partial [Synechocystis sp.]|nr:hypothetical protein [Synechocystis sp.]
LEFIDDQGNLIANRFNNTVRVINYQPGGQDALSQLMRDEVTLAKAYGLTGAPVPEFLPDMEKLVEDIETIVLPADDNSPDPVEDRQEINMDKGVESSLPSLIETEPSPVVLPPNPAESQVDGTEEMPKVVDQEVQTDQADQIDVQNTQNPDQVSPASEDPQLTQAEEAALAPLEERIEVLEEIIKTEVSPTAPDQTDQ